MSDRGADERWRRELCEQLAGGRWAEARDQLGERFPDPHPGLAERVWIDDHHRAMAAWPTEGGLVRTDIPGFLRRADALALYEHAHRGSGDVLELGSAWGLSTSILCRALLNSRRRATVVSVEIDAEHRRATRHHLEREGLLMALESIGGDAARVLPQLAAQGRRFGFAFVDHDHRLAATREACANLGRLLLPGGLALFHDFNDERNRTAPQDYGVFDGVRETLQAGGWCCVDIVGCCALLRRDAE